MGQQIEILEIFEFFNFNFKEIIKKAEEIEKKLEKKGISFPNRREAILRTIRAMKMKTKTMKIRMKKGIFNDWEKGGYNSPYSSSLFRKKGGRY